MKRTTAAAFRLGPTLPGTHVITLPRRLSRAGGSGGRRLLSSPTTTATGVPPLPEAWAEHQKALRRLPVPELDQTLARYIDYVTPLLSQDEGQLARTRALVQEFARGEGGALQKELLALDRESPTSWLEGWWDTMYLTIRDPLPINVNPFFVMKDDPDRDSQLARAAGLANACAKFQRLVLTGRLAADLERTTPLDMSQYTKLLGAARIPHPSRDAMLYHPNSRHMVVLSHNHYYTVEIITEDGGVVPEKNIQRQLQLILNESGPFGSREPDIGVLTADWRDSWANMRSELISTHEDNRRTLNMIDSALFVLVLEPEAPKKGDDIAKVFLHGDMRQRWFDKFQVIVASNGTAGVNLEHTPVDGHTAIRLPAEISDLLKTSEGETNSTSVPRPQRLKWHLPPTVIKGIEKAEAVADELVSRTEIRSLEFNHFGKKFITSKKLSPDGFVQMAYQLAYYRLTGKTASTYESCMTKQFLHGRTETLRSVTKESVAFTKTFSAPQATAQEKEQSLRLAVKAHGERAKEAKEGFGVDRHLFGLKNLAYHKQQRLPNYSIPAIFQDTAYQVLSSSVLSTSNCGSDALTLFGFGPVVSNGLGLGYMIQNEKIPITVSSFQKQAMPYAQELEKSLLEMRQVLNVAH
jgi:carnitine O-acetyltransferase